MCGSRRARRHRVPRAPHPDELHARSSAQWRSSAAGRRAGETRRGGGSGRRKSCQFCRDKIEQVDYKDVGTLRKFISDRGKIRSRRITGACRRHQNQIGRAVKRARELALLPYVPSPAATIAGAPATANANANASGADATGHPAPGRGDARRARPVVDVSKGYLRNFLIPRKLAEPATKSSIEAAKRRETAAERAVAQATARAEEEAELLNKTVLTIAHQAGDDGRLSARSRPRTSRTRSATPAASRSTAARSTSTSRSRPSALGWSASRSATASSRTSRPWWSSRSSPTAAPGSRRTAPAARR